MSFVRLQRVVKTYTTPADDFHTSLGVDAAIAEGEFVAVLGRWGSGKSTILNMIPGIDRPTAGEVHVSGDAVHAMGESDLARWRGTRVGVICQFF